jgi:flagellar motor switch protein FliN/FliY
MADDDLLSPEEIEALLSSAGAGRPPASVPAQPATPTQSAPAATRPAQAPATAAERLLEQAEADLRAAVSPILTPPGGRGPDAAKPAPFNFPAFAPARPAGGQDLALQALEDVELDLHVELGRAELLIEDVLKLREGSVVPLDKLAGDPVDIIVNGRLIARGEVLVLNDNFCVRVAEILPPEC